MNKTMELKTLNDLIKYSESFIKIANGYNTNIFSVYLSEGDYNNIKEEICKHDDLENIKHLIKDQIGFRYNDVKFTIIKLNPIMVLKTLEDFKICDNNLIRINNSNIKITINLKLNDFNNLRDEIINESKNKSLHFLKSMRVNPIYYNGKKATFEIHCDKN